jgi:hypothetical protein
MIFNHFKTNYIKNLLIVDIEINKSNVVLKAYHNSEQKNITLIPNKWSTFWGLLKHEPITPFSILINPPLPKLNGESALKVLKEFKAWLTLQQQKEKLLNNDLKSIAESEPHLINQNKEFMRKLINHKGGKQAVFNNTDYQLYCWAKFIHHSEDISYSKACDEAIKRCGKLTSNEKTSEYAISLKKDITDRYEKEIGLRQITGTDIPVNDFF